MARTPITAVTKPVTGYNLTDSADFETLSTGAGNGVSFAQDANQVIHLKNTSGGAAVFTIKVPTPSAYTPFSLTMPDKTFNVANGKTLVVPASSIFRQPDGDIYIDCDVAGQVLVLA